MEINQQAYSSQDTVKRYISYTGLQKAEFVIFEKYTNVIKGGSVLDIGIGAGRTTEHLAKMARQYIGVDFSQPFVDICKKKYENHPNVIIDYGDARSLPQFADGQFNFILFSFNGIDYVDYEGRTTILKELNRLLKKGGVLSFSFHNKGNIDALYSFHFSKNPFNYIGEWERKNKVRKVNGKKENYLNKDWFIIKDGGENFMLDTFYSDPLFQQKELEQNGFDSIRFYEPFSGSELTGRNIQESKCPWIYTTALKK